MKDLLVLLGKRVHDLRVAKKWSQEEFAHVSGLHRTYIGQIERGEKNISFGNLVKVAAVLGVTASELLSALEGSRSPGELRSTPARSLPDIRSHRQEYEIQKLLSTFKHQRAAMDQTMNILEGLLATGPVAKTSSGTSARKRTPKK